jgi:tetratricopeptide (TPR) repeat protein
MNPDNRYDLPVVKLFLFILIATPVLAMGAVHAESAGVYFAAAAVFAGYLFMIQKARLPPMDFPSFAMLGLLSFTWLQIIPLPSEVVSLIAPLTYDIRARALSPLHMEPSGWMPLSLDVTCTVQEVGKLAFYLLVYWGARFIVRRRGPNFILTVITVAGIMGAAVLLVHRILMVDKIYGFYTPLFAHFTRDRISAPLINENHMAAFLGLCATAAVGRATATVGRARRIVAFTVAALIGGTVVLTLSRGGIAAFVLGQCLFIGMRILAERQAGSSYAVWLPAVSAVSLGLGFFVARDALLGELLNGGMNKIDLFQEEMPLIGRFPLFGAGRGAFMVAFPAVSKLSAAMVVTHAENVVIQLLADWGLIVGGFALIAGAFIVVRFFWRPPSSVQSIAAVAALTAFGIHNLVDFNMEVIGVAVIPCAFVAILYGRESMNRRPDVRRVPMILIALTIATAAVASASAFFYVRPFGIDNEESRLREEIKKADSIAFSPESLKEILSRHPSDAYIPLIVGIRLYHFKTENPLPWLARAITLKPLMPEAHFYIGAALMRGGRIDQAMLEFRTAARIKPSVSISAARLLVSRNPTFDALFEIAITDDDRKVFFPALAAALSVGGQEEEADKADLAVLRVVPNDTASASRHVRRLMDKEAFDDAEEWAGRLMKREDSFVLGVMLMSEIYAEKEAFGQSVVLLENAIQKIGRHPELQKRLAEAKQRLGDFEGAMQTAELLKAKSSNATDRMRAILLQVDLQVAEHRIQGALQSLREANSLDPSNLGILEATFALAVNAGDKQRALEALLLLAEERPNDKAIQSRLTAFRDSLKHSAEDPK